MSAVGGGADPFDGGFLEALRAHFQGAPYPTFLGMEIAPLAPGFARVELPFKPELVGDYTRPALHGGVLTSVMDTCGGLAIWTHAGPTARLSTIDLRVDFLKPAGPKKLITEARVLRAGKRIGVAEIKCFHDDAPDVLLGFGVGAYSIVHLDGGAPLVPGAPNL